MWCRRAGLALGLGVVGVSYASLVQPPSNALAARPCASGCAVVTGGSRGIGAATSRQLAVAGYDVVVVYRAGATEAAAVVEQIETSGGRATAIQADMGDESQIVELFEQVDSFRGKTPLRVLVNNAGVLGPKEGLQQLTADNMLAVFKTNTIGPALCIREAEKRMSTAHGHSGGAIVQISSGSAYIGRPLIYASSKGALNSLTIGLVSSLAKDGIRINTISPGMTATDMIAETLPRWTAPSRPHLMPLSILMAVGKWPHVPACCSRSEALVCAALT